MLTEMSLQEKRQLLKEYCGCTECADCVFGYDDQCTGMYPYERPDEEIDYLFSRIKEAPDNVNHPSHYTQGKVECIEAMESAFGCEAVENFCLCNAFKYIWRAKHKNGTEDLDKAIWYINKFKELAADEREETDSF